MSSDVTDAIGVKEPKALRNCHSIADLRQLARRRLPELIFDFVDGAAESEATARRNTAAFDDVWLVPRTLVDVQHVSTSTRVLGQNLEWPILCSPTGASRLFHPDGELAVARAAASSGILYSLSTGSTYSLESVAAATEGRKVFQLYMYKNREITWELIDRAKRSGYAALCLTVDVPAIGNRERDLRSGFTLPFKLTARTLLSFARHPAWVLGQASKGRLLLANFTERAGSRDINAQSSALGVLDSALTWKDVREVADRWGGPFALKGIMSADDARQACDAGVTAVIVSNHGGRQLDGAAAPLDVLPQIARAVGDRTEIILDGGVRRGVHVLKALARGAKACSIGRPYLYGLAAGGQAGVARALNLLHEELILAMRLAGCPDISSVNDTLIWQAE